MDRNPKVIELVRKAIAQDYDTPSSELQKAAIKIDPSLKRRSGLSFFASYVLPERRAKNGSKPGPKAEKRAKAESATPPSPDQSPARMPENAPLTSPQVDVPSGRSTGSRANASEEGLRRMLFEVAQDAMRVESRSDFVNLLARIDKQAKDLAAAMSSK